MSALLVILGDEERQLGPQFGTEEEQAASPTRESIDRDAVELALP